MMIANLTFAFAILILLGLRIESKSTGKTRGNRKYALTETRCRPKCNGFWDEGFCRSDIAIAARNWTRYGDMIEVEVIKLLKGADVADVKTRDDGRKYLSMKDANKCRCHNEKRDTIPESDLAADVEFMMNGFVSEGSLYAGEYRIALLSNYQFVAAHMNAYPSTCEIIRQMSHRHVPKNHLLEESNVKLRSNYKEFRDTVV